MKMWWIAIGLVGCTGSAPAPQTPAPIVAPSAPVAAREPIEVAVDAQRFGGSVRLDVQGVGRGVTEGEAFEDPTAWRISARAGRRELTRLVNGSVRVDRNPVGGPRVDQWDTTVRFSVVYEAPPEVTEIAVRIEPPASPALDRVLAL